MKNYLFMLALSLFVSIAHISAQVPQKICVAPTTMGTGSGFPMYNACSISNLPAQLYYLSGDVEIYFAGGDYYNVSLNLSGLNYQLITSIHLIGGINQAYMGNNINRGIQDWNAYPTIFHANASTPSASVIDINNFSLSSQSPISSVEGIIITSDNYLMSSNAIHLLAGNYGISNCQVTEYKTTNRLIMLEVGELDAYIISSLIDNNTSWVLLGMFGNIHVINATIAENAYSYFIDGLTQDIEIFNTIMWKNPNVDIYSQYSGHAYVSHSFIESMDLYMADDNTNQWNVDPLFTYDVDVPYTCTPNSGIFNYGDGNLLTFANVPSYMQEYDIDHNDRFYNSAGDTLDVGAYQHYYDDGGANYEPDLQSSGSRGVKKRLQSENSSSDVVVWAHGNNVCICGYELGSSRLSIYSTDGRLAFSTNLHEGANVIPTYLHPGEYIAVVYYNQNEKICSQGIIIQ